MNTFRGISLTSLVSKVLCNILENRLSCIAEEKGLIAEEQGGFRKREGMQGPTTVSGVIRSNGGGEET